MTKFWLFFIAGIILAFVVIAMVWAIKIVVIALIFAAILYVFYMVTKGKQWISNIFKKKE